MTDKRQKSTDQRMPAGAASPTWHEELVHFTGTEGNRLVGRLFSQTATCPYETPLVLMLHGGGQTRFAWRRSAEHLVAEGFAVVTLDQRGHGESDWVSSGHYAFRDFAGDLIRVVQALGAQFGTRPIAVGASLGGLASLLAEGEKPGLFAGLVLVDITPRMDQGGVGRIQGFMRERMAEGFASLDEAADAVAHYLPNRTRPPSAEGLRKNLRLGADGRYRWHWDPRFMDGPRPVHHGGHVAVESDLLTAAKTLSLPTLLVRGGRSELVSEAYAREFCDMVEQAEFVDVSDAGHMVAGDKNDAFSDAVVQFARRFKADAAPG